MSDQNAPYPGPEAHAAPEPVPSGTPTRFVTQAMSEPEAPSTAPAGQHGLGPFTLREWILMGLGVILVVLSFLPLFPGSGYSPIWTLGAAWIGAVALPVVACLLLGLRRFTAFRNIGSFSIDQAASVAFVISALAWLDAAAMLTQLSSAIGGMFSQLSDGFGGFFGGEASQFENPFAVGPVVWIGLVVALAGVFFTVFARFVAPFSEDFQGREEIPAHPVARPARPLIRAERPAAPAPTPAPGFGWPQQAPEQTAADQRAQELFAPLAQDTQAVTAAAPAPAPQPEYPAPAPQAEPQAQAPKPEPEVAKPEPEVAQPEAPADASADASQPTPDATVDAAADTAQPAPEAAREDETAAAAEVPAESAAQETSAQETTVLPVAAQAAEPEPRTTAMPQAAPQPFWALAPVERDVHDVEGRPIYTVGPTAWALVLEDRGTYFVMRHDDGRIGYLHDVSGITRG